MSHLIVHGRGSLVWLLSSSLFLPPLSLFHLALSRAKDAAGNISFKDIQTMQDKVSSLSDQFDDATRDEDSKKDD